MVMTMDYEKKYKEALAKARELYNDEQTHVGMTPTHLTEIFPELQDSEDERIRKEIIATIHLYYGEPLEDEAKEMLAWLEKQGKEDSSIQQAYKQGYIEGQRIERKCWLEKQQTMNPKEMRDLLRMEYSKGRYDTITKAIEWLDENLLDYWGQQNSDPSNLLIEFKKAMEL